MRVILIKDVNELGKKYDVKNVKIGYARNYLIPKGLAKPASKEALKWLEAQSETIKKKQEEDLKATQENVSKIDGIELSFSVKIGEKGQLFESINAEKIKAALKEETGIDFSKKQIKLKEPIKSTGEFPVKIVFDHNLEASIKVIISEGE